MEKDAAQLAHGLLTGVEWTAEADVEMPGEVNCGSKKIVFNGGTTRGSSGVAVGEDRVQYDWKFRIQLPIPENARDAKAESYRFDCDVKIESGYEVTATQSVRVLPPLSIPSCDGFNCSYSSQKLDCAKLQKELPSACQ